MSAPQRDPANAARPLVAAVCGAISARVLYLSELVLWLAAFILLPLLVIVLIGLVVFAVFAPPSWYYSISARSEAAALTLPAERETSWRIEGATLCSTEALEGLAALDAVNSPCGARRWQAYALPQAQELVLALGGSPASSGRSIAVSMETRSDRGLQASIRGEPGVTSLGVLRLVDQGIDIALGRELNLIWPGEARPRDLMFPFIADHVRVGRDVTWSDTSLLHEGSMEIFTATEEHLSKRTRVEEAELLPGDQVRLDRFDGDPPLQPKGFLRFDRFQADDSPGTLTAVAFGRAESLRIERFGDSGYDFQPHWLAKFTQNRLLLMVSGFIGGLLGLLGGYAVIRDIHARSPARARASYKARCGGKPEPPSANENTSD